ncbi:MAG TPA: hypothetical protein VM491_20770, partial [Burkholderiaceae bacterium]|nr:hypothetical protein [Burkholderiaceae bacterium]
MAAANAPSYPMIGLQPGSATGAVTASRATGNGPAESPARGSGIRARLLLALLSITLFAVLSAAAGIHAFRAVGERLDVIDRRVPPTVAALELSRSAERIIAAAPALLAVNDRARRDELKAALAYEVAQLNERLLALRSDGPQALPLAPIDTLVGSLTARLQELDGLVARRLETNDRVAALRRRVFDTNAEIQRLLGPWLDVLDSQVVRASQDVQPAAWPEAEPAGHNLPSLIALQRLTQSAQRQVGAAVDLLAEVSTAEQLRRIDVLEFQLGLALRELVQTAAGLDPRLRPLFLEQVGHLRRISDGPSALAEARRQEIALQRAGSETLAAISDLSNQLSAQVDRLGRVARSEVGDAVRDALSVQQASTRTMATLVSLSLLTSALIAWLYVGRNILRRLSSLSDRMLAIAS